MKKLMPQVILALLLIAFNFSCKKTTEQNQQLLNSNQLEVKDGVITFNTSADFREAMLHFQQYSPAILQDKVKRLNGFKSILGLNPNTARNNSTNSAARLVIDDTPPAEPIFFEDSLVQDPYVQSIINDKREISINGYIVRITEKGVFAYLPAMRTNFENVYPTLQFETGLTSKFTNDNSNLPEELQVVVPNVFLVARQAVEVFESISFRPGPCGLGSNIFGQIGDCDDAIDSRRRIRYTTYAQNLGFYSSIGFKTRRQTRFLRIWWAANAQNLTVVGEGKYESKWPTNTLTEYSYTRDWTLVIENNTNKAERVLSWHTGQFGIKNTKPTLKFAKSYKYKIHRSDHTARNNDVNYQRRMAFN